MTEMKTYIRPTMTVVKIQTGTLIMQSDPVKVVNGGDTGIGYNSIVTTDDARVKQHNIWDSEW